MLGTKYPLSNSAAHQVRSIAALTIFILLCLGGVLSSQANAATVTTDRPEYFPGEEAVIDGATFRTYELVSVQVTQVDGNLLSGDGSTPWTVPASDVGDFTTYWPVEWEYSGQTLLITATGMASGEKATATFLAPQTNMDQLQNGTTTTPPAWANGNINSSNSCYSEGNSVAYRYFIKELNAGTPHYFTIQMEWTKATIHALDYLTDYDATEDSAITLTGGPCGTIATSPPPGCSAPTESFALPDFLSTANYSGTIPPDFFTTVNPGFVLDGPRNLMAYNCTIDSVGKYVFNGSASDRTLEFIVYFTVDTTGSIGFFWGGHLASSSASAWGYGMGSSSVSGAPYHMRALSLDGGGGAGQDRSIQNGVICLPPNVGIIASASEICNIGPGSYVARDTASSANMWTWTVINGTIVGPDNLDSVVFTANPGLVPGDSVYIMVESCDSTSGCPGDFCCASDMIALPVIDCNSPPVVYCNTPDTSVFLCDSGEVCVGGFDYSDPDNNIASVTVSLGTLTNDTVCFDPAEGENMIILTVIDSLGEMAVCTTLVTVAFNDPPTASCPGNTSMFVCDLSPITLPGFSCDDPDGNLDSCIVSNGTLNGDEVTFTPVEGDNTIILTAKDICGEISACTTIVHVDLNSAPVCNVPSDGSYFVCGDSTFSFPVSATDADGNLVGCVKDSGPGTLAGGYWTFTTTGPGVYTAIFTCTDECEASCTDTANITVTYNQPPVATCRDDTSMFVCDLSPITLSGFSCDDPDGNLDSCIVSNGTLSGDEVTFTPVEGDNTIILTAKDVCGEVSACTTIVHVALNSAPVCIVPPDSSYFVCGDTTFSFPISADDPDGNLVGCVMDSGPGTLAGGYWTFTTTGPGVYTAIFTCTDVCEASCTDTVNITVTYNQPPIVNCPPDTTYNFSCGPEEICYGSGFTSTDPDNNIASETVSLGTLTDGSVCFTPDTAGVYEIVYTVIDSCDDTAQCTTYITVNYTNRPPVANCPGDATFSFTCDLGEVCVGPFSASDPDNNVESETVSLGTLSNDTVCFTPTAPGNYDIIYTVTDSCGLVAACTTTVTVQLSNDPPVATCPGNISVTWCELKDTCIGPFECTDPDGNLATCEVVGYTLSGGEVCLTPAEGDNVLTLIATDSCGLADTCSATLTVTLIPPPVINDTTVTIVLCEPGDTCIALPPVTGGLAPFTWTFDGRPVADTVCFNLPDDTVITGQLIITDDCGHSDTATLTINATVNTAPIVTVDPPELEPRFLCNPDTVCVKLRIFDPDDGLSGVSEHGILDLRDSTVCFYIDTSGHYCDHVYIIDSCGLSATVDYCFDVQLSRPPVCDLPNDGSYFVCGDTTFHFSVSATDPDGSPTSCVKTSGPGTLIDAIWTFTTDGPGVYTASFVCTDTCGDSCTGTVNITVNYNQPPLTVCPGDFSVTWSELKDTCIGPFECSDPDGNLTHCYCLIDGDTVTLAGDQLCFTPVYGENHIYLIAEDTCGLADTCETIVTVIPPELHCPIIRIEKTHGTLQGHFETVSITIESEEFSMGGFDFLIAYDASALAFSEAMPGQLLVDCGWEYFTYRYGVDGNCGDACPSGLLRIVALAETSNGPNHPNCFGPPDADPHGLAELTFFVSNDRTFNCQYVPIYFFWFECNDNAISNVSGDTLLLVSRIYDYEGNLIWDEEDNDLFPDAARPPFTGVPDYCLEGDKLTPIRCMDVQNGGIDIICSDSIDVRGDINANGVPYEVADAVMLTNYFISGLEAFGDHVEASIAASDVNADGMTLSVADLVYLVRVITGDAEPYAKASQASRLTATMRTTGDQVVVDYESAVSVGAVLLVFTVDGPVGDPMAKAGAADMDMIYGIKGNQLRVLIFDIGPGSIPSGAGELMAVPVDGSIQLSEIEAADYYGNMMSISTGAMPTEFALEQNRPNPFNPATDISLRLPTASEWTLAIYNIAGQRIREFSGYSEAGTVTVTWDGTDDQGRRAASGIYLYKATAGEYSATRKMVLMK